jgi:hypothetical protein
MSLAELKNAVVELSPDERLELAALIAHLNQANDPQYQSELDRRMAAMDAGKKQTQVKLQQLHQDLIRRGQ